MRSLFTVIILTLFGCSTKDPVHNPEGGYWKLPPTEDVEDRGYTERLLQHHVYGSGFVGSLGKFDGDSALFSGIAMGAVPCDKAEVFLHGFETMVEANDGGFVRNWPLDSEYVEKNNEYSKDQHVGVVFGLMSLKRRCPEYGDRVTDIWNKNQQFIEDTGGDYLHPNANLSKINQPIRVLNHLMSGKDINEGDIMDLEGFLIVGAMGIGTAKTACYPVHLGTMAIVTMWLGGRPISKLGMDAFCEQTNGMDLPLTDFLCTRISARLWLETYIPNQWEYRHQRCGSWESSPDARESETHGVDYLIMEALASKTWRAKL